MIGPLTKEDSAMHLRVLQQLAPLHATFTSVRSMLRPQKPASSSS